jgi:drug/metabolite transporter (DMT)-like permease
MLVIPVVGVLSGMLFLGERPSAAECGAALLIVASLATVVLPARAAPAPARDSTT